MLVAARRGKLAWFGRTRKRQASHDARAIAPVETGRRQALHDAGEYGGEAFLQTKADVGGPGDAFPDHRPCQSGQPASTVGATAIDTK
jgi:hypothetical protein